MAEQARVLFLAEDPEPACRRWNLPYDEAEIRIRLFSREFRISRKDGIVTGLDGKPADFNTVLSLYDVLCHPGIPVLSGSYTPVTSLNRIHGTHSVHESLNDRASSLFSGKADLLCRLCMEHNGVPYGNGDVSFLLPAFDFFPIWFRFWDADEEFPASLQFLWDQNALQFVHYETLWYMSSELVSLFSRALSLTKNTE